MRRLASLLLEALVGYWAEATREKRREFVQLFVLPERLHYDLPGQRIVAVQPRAAFLRPRQLALADWKEQDGILCAASKLGRWTKRLGATAC